MRDEDRPLYIVCEELTPDFLLSIYPLGFFPYYCEGEPIFCFNPSTRCVLYPERFRLSSRTRRYASQLHYSSAFDRNFSAVISHCATTTRRGQSGTWITEELRETFLRLFERGEAHSFEVYRDDTLCGGLYGLWIGEVFYGESMFSLSTQASVIALANLCSFARLHNIRVIDCQMETAHLMSHGATLLSRNEFLNFTKPKVW